MHHWIHVGFTLMLYMVADSWQLQWLPPASVEQCAPLHLKKKVVGTFWEYYKNRFHTLTLEKVGSTWKMPSSLTCSTHGDRSCQPCSRCWKYSVWFRVEIFLCRASTRQHIGLASCAFTRVLSVLFSQSVQTRTHCVGHLHSHMHLRQVIFRKVEGSYPNLFKHLWDAQSNKSS